MDEWRIVMDKGFVNRKDIVAYYKSSYDDIEQDYLLRCRELDASKEAESTHFEDLEKEVERKIERLTYQEFKEWREFYKWQNQLVTAFKKLAHYVKSVLRNS